MDKRSIIGECAAPFSFQLCAVFDNEVKGDCVGFGLDVNAYFHSARIETESLLVRAYACLIIGILGIFVNLHLAVTCQSVCAGNEIGCLCAAIGVKRNDVVAVFELDADVAARVGMNVIECEVEVFNRLVEIFDGNVALESNLQPVVTHDDRFDACQTVNGFDSDGSCDVDIEVGAVEVDDALRGVRAGSLTVAEGVCAVGEGGRTCGSDEVEDAFKAIVAVVPSEVEFAGQRVSYFNLFEVGEFDGFVGREL